MVKTQFNRSFLFFIEEMPIKSGKGYSRKNTWGGGGGAEGGRRQAIYFSMGGWCGKFSNYMGHWCSTKSVGVSLRGRGKKNIISQKKKEVLI